MSELIDRVMHVMSRESSGFVTEISVRAALAEVFGWLEDKAEFQDDARDFIQWARTEVLGWPDRSKL